MAVRVDYVGMAAWVREAILEELEECAEVASTYGGWIFGGYVRDVIIPRLCDSRRAVSWRNLDLWFTTPMAADNFRKAVGCKLQLLSGRDYRLIVDDTEIAIVTIVISALLPVDDFEEHRILARRQQDRWVISEESTVGSCLTMLPEYRQRLLSEETVCVRLQERFLDRGYSLKIPLGSAEQYLFVPAGRTMTAVDYRRLLQGNSDNPVLDRLQTSVDNLHTRIASRADLLHLENELRGELMLVTASLNALLARR